jgi:citrate lyase subunit beta/citryl-CoA lyase
MLAKARECPADLMLYNLEDGVAPAAKDRARQNVVDVLKSADPDAHEVIVRINSLASETGLEDLAAIVPCRPHGICIPKVEEPDEIDHADASIRELETRCGLARGVTRLHAMIETAGGVLNAGKIARASARMTALIFGSADYSAQVRCRPSADRMEMMLALQWIVTSARAAGIASIDAPCFDLENTELLRSESAQSRNIGFDGKSALHPRQLEIINAVFDVTEEEALWAERVIAKLDAAEKEGRSLSTIDGGLVEDPHRISAERILRRWRQLRG